MIEISALLNVLSLEYQGRQITARLLYRLQLARRKLTIKVIY
jgi:hypothetical protein